MDTIISIPGDGTVVASAATASGQWVWLFVLLATIVLAYKAIKSKDD